MEAAVAVDRTRRRSCRRLPLFCHPLRLPCCPPLSGRVITRAAANQVTPLVKGGSELVVVCPACPAVPTVYPVYPISPPFASDVAEGCSHCNVPFHLHGFSVFSSVVSSATLSTTADPTIAAFFSSWNPPHLNCYEHITIRRMANDGDTTPRMCVCAGRGAGGGRERIARYLVVVRGLCCPMGNPLARFRKQGAALASSHNPPRGCTV